MKTLIKQYNNVLIWLKILNFDYKGKKKERGMGKMVI